MTDTPPYPECLRRPDAGGQVQSRNSQSEDSYRKRYAGMAKTLCRRLGVDMVTPAELAADLGQRAPGLKANALKQYNAGVRQHLRDLWDEGAISQAEVERIDALLQKQTSMGKGAKGKTARRTSAGRAKSVKPAPLAALVGKLLSHSTPIRRIAAGQLEYGVSLATRPSEFLTLREDQQGRLWVASAKFSAENRKGLQRARMVIVDGLEPFEIDELKEIAALLENERTAGATTRSLLSRCQRAIRMARESVRSGSRKVTAYTVRHQARANMVAMGMSPEEVAVVMNHSSAMTAQSHYAPGRQAWKGMKGATPPSLDPRLVAKVRPGNHTRGWTVEPKPRLKPE